MSAEISTITDLPKEIVAEVKEQAKPATTSGITSQLVGFAIGVPLSMLYDWLYSAVASKYITNEIARDVLKVAMPLGIGLTVHIAKIPYGNYLAGTAYAIAIVSAGRILYSRIKGLLGKANESDMTDDEAEKTIWGVQ